MNTIMELLNTWEMRARKYRKSVRVYETTRQHLEAELTAGQESELRRCSRELKRIITFEPRKEQVPARTIDSGESTER